MFTPRGPGAGSFQHTLWPRGRVAYVFSWYKVIIALSLCFSSGALQNTVHTSIITAKMVWLNFFFELQYFGPDLRLAPTKTSQYKMQTADCRPGTKCRPQARYKIQTDSLKCFFVWFVMKSSYNSPSVTQSLSAIIFHDYLHYCGIILAVSWS